MTNKVYLMFLDEVRCHLPRTRADHFVHIPTVTDIFRTLELVHNSPVLVLDTLLVTSYADYNVGEREFSPTLLEEPKVPVVGHVENSVDVQTSGAIGGFTDF